nr:putative oxidoreductase [Salmonella sp. NCTC 7297]
MAGIGHDIEAVKKYVGAAGMEMLFKISNLAQVLFGIEFVNTILMLISSPDMVIWPTTSGS